MPSEEHEKLVKKAILWLSEKDYVRIKTEFRVAAREDTGGSYVLDVVGFLSQTPMPVMVAIECGGTESAKIENLIQRRICQTIFLWPYGAEEPFEWKPNMNLCATCGSHIGYKEK